MPTGSDVNTLPLRAGSNIWSMIHMLDDISHRLTTCAALAFIEINTKRRIRSVLQKEDTKFRWILLPVEARGSKTRLLVKGGQEVLPRSARALVAVAKAFHLNIWIHAEGEKDLNEFKAVG
jgi:hypothetical protein